MSQGENAAFPFFGNFLNRDQKKMVVANVGLTKRELFAAMAMQAITNCTAEPTYAAALMINAKGQKPGEYIAQLAIQQADALIAELNKNEVGK